MKKIELYNVDLKMWMNTSKSSEGKKVLEEYSLGA